MCVSLGLGAPLFFTVFGSAGCEKIFVTGYPSSWGEFQGECTACEYVAVADETRSRTHPHIFYTDFETNEREMVGGGRWCEGENENGRDREDKKFKSWNAALNLPEDRTCCEEPEPELDGRICLNGEVRIHSLETSISIDVSRDLWEEWCPNEGEDCSDSGVLDYLEEHSSEGFYNPAADEPDRICRIGQESETCTVYAETEQ